MSADEGLLARWVRRKSGAAQKAHDGPKPKETGDRIALEETPVSLPPQEAQPRFDPASQPPIESTGAGSDIRPFLAAGVPADLTRAALRQAWLADPAIRDFIGLCENSWDFNAPGGASGFGSLTAEDARRLVARVMDESNVRDPPHPAPQPISDDQAVEPASGPGQRPQDSSPDQRKPARDAKAAGDIAMRHERGERETRLALPRRHHGGALPD